MNRNDLNQNPNRDPMTGQPGSHPVGTAAGAVSGGAVGAAVGSAAGPVGAGVGAAAGALAGSAVGKATGEHFNPTRGGDLGRFIDYTVVDRSNDKVGTVDAVWEDHTGQPMYLAVRTGWLGIGKAHVVPAERAEVNETAKKIRLPYTNEHIKNAPSFDAQEDINAQAEFTIATYYGLDRNQPTDGLTPPAKSRDDARVELKSEDLKVGKREIEYGGVRLRKIVRTETVNQPVQLNREEVVIERIPVSDRAVRGSDAAFADEDIYIPLRREEPVVEKTVRAREEVRVGKRREREEQNVRGEVRHEDVEIEQQGDLAGSSRASRR